MSTKSFYDLMGNDTIAQVIPQDTPCDENGIPICHNLEGWVQDNDAEDGAGMSLQHYTAEGYCITSAVTQAKMKHKQNQILAELGLDQFPSNASFGKRYNYTAAELKAQQAGQPVYNCFKVSTVTEGMNPEQIIALGHTGFIPEANDPRIEPGHWNDVYIAVPGMLPDLKPFTRSSQAEGYNIFEKNFRPKTLFRHSMYINTCLRPEDAWMGVVYLYDGCYSTPEIYEAGMGFHWRRKDCHYSEITITGCNGQHFPISFVEDQYGRLTISPPKEFAIDAIIRKNFRFAVRECNRMNGEAYLKALREGVEFSNEELARHHSFKVHRYGFNSTRVDCLKLYETDPGRKAEINRIIAEAKPPKGIELWQGTVIDRIDKLPDPVYYRGSHWTVLDDTWSMVQPAPVTKPPVNISAMMSIDTPKFNPKTIPGLQNVSSVSTESELRRALTLIENLTKDVERLEAENEELTETIPALENQTDMVRENSLLKRAIQHHTTVNARLVKELAEQAVQLDEVRVLYTESVEKCVLMDTQRQQLQVLNDDLVHRIASTLDQLKEAENQIDTFQVVEDNYRRQVLDLQNQLTTASEEVTGLKAINDLTNLGLETSTTTKNQLRSDYEALLTQHEDLTNEHNETIHTMAVDHEMAMGLQEDYANSLAATVEELTNQLNQLKEEMAIPKVDKPLITTKVITGEIIEPKYEITFETTEKGSAMLACADKLINASSTPLVIKFRDGAIAVLPVNRNNKRAYESLIIQHDKKHWGEHANLQAVDGFECEQTDTIRKQLANTRAEHFHWQEKILIDQIKEHRNGVYVKSIDAMVTIEDYLPFFNGHPYSVQDTHTGYLNHIDGFSSETDVNVTLRFIDNDHRYTTLYAVINEEVMVLNPKQSQVLENGIYVAGLNQLDTINSNGIRKDVKYSVNDITTGNCPIKMFFTPQEARLHISEKSNRVSLDKEAEREHEFQVSKLKREKEIIALENEQLKQTNLQEKALNDKTDDERQRELLAVKNSYEEHLRASKLEEARIATEAARIKLSFEERLQRHRNNEIISANEAAMEKMKYESKMQKMKKKESKHSSESKVWIESVKACASVATVAFAIYKLASVSSVSKPSFSNLYGLI